MKYMTAQQIRETWFKFFADKGHQIIESSSLIPQNDPTLLWINAGVAPLKKYFDGTQIPTNKRMTNAQKCIRTNDIDNVGKTARHHTFFEMLGNFSIGDYFKEEAIIYGYELLTSPKYFNFSPDILYITYYPSDQVTKQTWISCGIKEDHLIPLDLNFWEIGAGPSGPCTEIFVDRGPKYGQGGKKLIADDIENDRFVEIYNIVFSQFNADPAKKRSEYLELPNKNIDTGAGLERIAAILQDKPTNFETDLFYPIIEHAVKLSNVAYTGQMAYKVIADHIKTLTMAICDGAVLSNEGRGYVLRRILRRALKFGRTLGLNQAFLYKLVDDVVMIMANQYPLLKQNAPIAKKVIQVEEEKFLTTLAEGEKLLLSKVANKKITGIDAFTLYDTYGFPIELTLEYASEHQITVDVADFEKRLEEQRNRSRASRNVDNSMNNQDEAYLNFKGDSKYVGYTKDKVNTTVIAVFNDSVVLKETPFYANQGGQVSDVGFINEIPVVDVSKMPNGQFLHKLNQHRLKVGDKVKASVDVSVQQSVRKNHSATHLLHQALKDVFGSHVNQQGSLVNAQLLRFDFNHYEAVTPDKILATEQLVRLKIKENLKVIISEMSLEKAKKEGATALFGEKYTDLVRVVKMGDYSKELCGGLHVDHTQEIGEFMISSIETIGSGIFRITAHTEQLENYLMASLSNITENINALENKFDPKTGYQKVTAPVIELSFVDIINYKHYFETVKQAVKTFEKEITRQQASAVLANIDKLIPAKYLSKTLISTQLEPSILKQAIDVLFDKMKVDTLVLVNVYDNKGSYLVKTKLANANTIIKEINSITQGSGGGRPDFAQGGTTNYQLLTDSIAAIKDLL